MIFVWFSYLLSFSYLVQFSYFLSFIFYLLSLISHCFLIRYPDIGYISGYRTFLFDILNRISCFFHIICQFYIRYHFHISCHLEILSLIQKAPWILSSVLTKTILPMSESFLFQRVASAVHAKSNQKSQR